MEQKLNTKVLLLIYSKNMSIRQVAKKSNIPPTTLQAFIEGTSKSPRIDTLYNLSKGLNISITDLLKNTEYDM